MNKEELETKIEDYESQIKVQSKIGKSLKEELKTFKKQLEELPKVEVGNWYKLTSDYCSLKEGMVFMCERNQDYEGSKYPFWVLNHNMFLDLKDGERNYLAPNQDDLTPATDKEVKEALILEAIKRGFKEGVSINPINLYMMFDEPLNTVISDIGSLDYSSYEKTFGLWVESGRWNSVIFHDGKWATIIKDKTTQLNGWYSKTQLLDVIDNNL